MKIRVVVLLCVAIFGLAQTGLSADQSSPRAAARAEQLKAKAKSFRLQLEYNGNQDKPYYNLTLSVPPTGYDRSNPFYRLVQINETQAIKIIDYLAAEGLLDHAVDLRGNKVLPPAMPGYILTVATTEHQLRQDLGWEMQMLKRLDELRKVLEGDAAKEMDVLLGRLAGHRREWEKDGVLFEIVVPERTWTIPENKPGASSAFLKLGLQITNKTDKPLRFNGFDTLVPELVTSDGKEAHRWEGPQATLRHRQAQERDFPLVLPGKSVTLPLQADLFWPTLEERTLMFRWWHASGSPGRYFDDLKPGDYKIRLVYENQSKTLRVESPQPKILDDAVWTGRVVTRFVPVTLKP